MRFPARKVGALTVSLKVRWSCPWSMSKVKAVKFGGLVSGINSSGGTNMNSVSDLPAVSVSPCLTVISTVERRVLLALVARSRSSLIEFRSSSENCTTSQKWTLEMARVPAVKEKRSTLFILLVK